MTLKLVGPDETTPNANPPSVDPVLVAELEKTLSPRLHNSVIARVAPSRNNSLVLAHLWLVDACAKDLSMSPDGSALWDDAVQDGRVALMRAAQSFNPERGTKFANYARMFVVGAIKTCISKDCPVSGAELRYSSRLKPVGVPFEARKHDGTTGGEGVALEAVGVSRLNDAIALLPVKLRNAARSMMRGLNPTEHGRAWLIPRQTASDHYRLARCALAKMFH